MTSLISPRIRPMLRCLGMLVVTLAMMGLSLHAQPQLTPQSESAATAPSQHLTVEQIVAKHYEAIGGDAHQQVQTMRMSGRSLVMGMEAPYTRYSKRPNKMLLEIYVQDMTGIQAFDGEVAWAFMPFMGQSSPAAMPPEQAKAVLEGADFDGPLAHAAESGHQVELLGVEQVNGHDAYKLQVTRKTGGMQTLYVDTETFYVTRVESIEGDADFLDYRVVDGHQIPHLVKMVAAMGEQTIYVDEVEFNVAIDDDVFSMR